MNAFGLKIQESEQSLYCFQRLELPRVHFEAKHIDVCPHVTTRHRPQQKVNRLRTKGALISKNKNLKLDYGGVSYFGKWANCIALITKFLVFKTLRPYN